MWRVFYSLDDENQQKQQRIKERVRQEHETQGIEQEGAVDSQCGQQGDLLCAGQHHHETVNEVGGKGEKHNGWKPH